jgi:hypothetical protein
MALVIKFDASELYAGIKKFTENAISQNRVAIGEIAYEILRLSTFEVPHDIGLLQASGSVQPQLSDADTVLVGYNKVYAARLHEHPEYHFQKGRKGKYLEDPIKNNLGIFRTHYKDSMSKIIK